MKKRLKNIILFFVVVTLLTMTASYIFLAGYIYPHIIRSTENIVREKTGGEISIGGMGVALFPPRLNITTVVFSIDDKKLIDSKIEEISLRLNPVQSLSGKIIIKELYFSGLDLYFQWEGLNKKMKTLAKAKSIDKKIRSPLVEVDIENIKISGSNISAALKNKGLLELIDATIDIERKAADEGYFTVNSAKGKVSLPGLYEEFSELEMKALLSNKSLFLEKISLKPKGGRLKGEVAIGLGLEKKVSGKIEGIIPLSRLNRYVKKAPRARGLADISADFTYGNKKGLEFSSYMAVSWGKFAGLPVRKLKASLSFSEKMLSLKEASFNMAGGKGFVEGHADLSTGLYDMNVNVNGIDPLKIKNKDFSLEGGMAGDISLRGNFKEPYHEGNFKASSKGVYFRGKKELYSSIKAEGSLGLSEGNLMISDARVRAEDLEINIKGPLLSDGEMDFKINLKHKKLGSLSDLLGKDIGGSLRLDGNLAGTFKKPLFAASVDARDLTYNNMKAQHLSGYVNYSGGTIYLDQIDLGREKSAIRLYGKVYKKGATPYVDVNINPSGSLYDIMLLIGKDYPLRGNVSGHVHLAGDIKKLKSEGKIKLEKGDIFGESFDVIELSGRFSDKNVGIRKLEVLKDGGSLSAKGSLLLPDLMDLTINAENIDLASIGIMRENFNGIKGRLYVDGEIKGRRDNPVLKTYFRGESVGINEPDAMVDIEGTVSAQLDMKKPAHSSISLALKNLNIFYLNKVHKVSSRSPLNYKDEILHMKKVTVVGPYARADFGGKISRNGPLDLMLSSSFNLAILKDYLKVVEKIEGPAEIKAKIGGNIKKPDVEATLSFRESLTQFKGFPYDLSDLSGSIMVSSELLKADSVEGKLQGSIFSGGGSLKMENLKPVETSFSFDMGTTELVYPDWLASKSRGMLTITGKGKEVTLGGDFEVLSASYTENIDLKSFLARLKTRKPVVEDAEEGEKSPLSYNFHFRADDNILVKNNLADIELRGYLNLVGRGKNISLLGELETIGGEAYFRNKEFSIARGKIAFPDKEKIVPYFDINAETKIKKYNIDMHILGKSDKYTIDLNSEPPMDEREIVSLITFGYTTGEIKGKGTEMTSLGAASLILQGELESKVKKYFGVDRFSIDPYYSERSGSTEARLTVGKELDEKVTATYSRGMTTLEEEVKLEYRVDDNLSLQGNWSSTEDQAGAFGGDVILRHEFR